jgi:indolepyruvate ferredoxin oxidoreductase, alpha subunit
MKLLPMAAYLNGVRVGAAYPGTPSTQIMENFATYPGVFAEWAPNEKVAMDVAIGAAYAGTRAMVSTKHVGLNVAADSLFFAVYTGINAGLSFAVPTIPACTALRTSRTTAIMPSLPSYPCLSLQTVKKPNNLPE